jgi:hypothetical protein
MEIGNNLAKVDALAKTGWLSKNFVLQGMVVFLGRRHTSGMSRSWKNAVTP